MKPTTAVLLGLCVAAATTTSPGLAAPPHAQPAPAGPDMAAFARGAKAWADNCARCHGMRDPQERSDAQWAVVMAHMRAKASLDGAVARDIRTFLQASN